MITEEVFQKLQELYKADQSLVNGLISVLPYFEFMQFNWSMRATYQDYLDRAKIDRDCIDRTAQLIIDAIKPI